MSVLASKRPLREHVLYWAQVATHHLVDRSVRDGGRNRVLLPARLTNRQRTGDSRGRERCRVRRWLVYGHCGCNSAHDGYCARSGGGLSAERPLAALLNPDVRLCGLLLAAGRLDADPDARPGRDSGAHRYVASTRVSLTLPVVVKARLASLSRGAGDLLPDGCKARLTLTEARRVTAVPAIRAFFDGTRKVGIKRTIYTYMVLLLPT